MERKCKCGGFLGLWCGVESNEKIYENLYQCIDCGKDYLFKDGEFKFISKAEFRRIVTSRKKLCNSKGE